MPDAALLLEHTSDGVAVLDHGLVLREANGRAALLYRRPVGQLVGRSLADLFPEVAATGGLAPLVQARGGTLPVRFEMFIPSLFAWHAVLAVPHAGGVVLFLRDVSDRVRRENEEAARAAVRKTIESMPLCVTITRGPQHRIEQANTLARALVGGRSVDGELLERVLPEARAQGFIAMLDGVFSSGQPYRGEEVALRWKPDPQGPERHSWFDLIYQPLLDEAGAVGGVLHLGTDVTDKVQRRLLIEQYAAERQAVLEQLDEGVIVTDAQGRITFVNDSAERLHGVRMLGVAPSDYTQAYSLLTDAGEPYRSADLPLARAVREQVTVQDAIWRIRRPDGSQVRVRGTAKPILGSDGRLLAGVLTVRLAAA